MSIVIYGYAGQSSLVVSYGYGQPAIVLAVFPRHLQFNVLVTLDINTKVQVTTECIVLASTTQNITTSVKANIPEVVEVVGALVMFAGTVAPSGWLFCDGASYDTTAQAALFAVIGYTYGGTGSNFNVPDLRGRIPIGSGSGVGLTPRTIASVGGQEKITDVPEHFHVNVPECTDQPGNSNGPSTNWHAKDSLELTADYETVDVDNTMKAWNSNNTGTAGGVDVMSPSLVLNFIIRG